MEILMSDPAVAKAAPLEDEDLVARILSGETEAFSELYERYLPRVYGYVRKRVSNRADTEETVQEVFIATFSSLASFRGEAPFAAWVLGIARRTVANRFKKKQHPMVPLDADTESESIDLMIPLLHRAATPDEQYECLERIARLEQAADEHLTQEQRHLFELHHLEHRSITDIAARLHKSEDAVKSNLYRARKVLLAR
jgi:RNA polymerase sigma-70 factor (ECF subfamily)